VPLVAGLRVLLAALIENAVLLVPGPPDE